MLDANSALLRFKSVIGDVRASFEHQKANDFSDVSPLWKTLFEFRDAALEYNDFALFLNDVSNSIDGAAGKYRSQYEKDRMIRYYSNYLNSDDLRQNPLKLVGAPTIFDFCDVACNTAYLENLNYYADIRKMAGPVVGWKGLDILEIGAGYGGLASLLINAGVARSYTIIDLPPNLQIGAFHLTQSYPSLAYRVARDGQAFTAEPFEGLTFTTAGNIDGLENLQFDLAINTDSLGEMPAWTAQAYISWIAQHLRPKGVFYSKNGHRRSSTGVQAASEYGYDQMDLLALEPIKTPSTLFADHSHRLLLSPRDPNRAKTDWTWFDTVCALFAIGLHDELGSLCDAIVEQHLSEDQLGFLDQATALFASPDFVAKAAVMSDRADPDLQLVVHFLRGVTRFFSSRRSAAEHLLQYLAGAKSHVAEATGLFFLFQLGDDRFQKPFQCGTRTAFMIEELEALRKLPAGARGLAFGLRNEVVRKKLLRAEHYRPSMLLNAKNILFNVREGKGFKAERH